MDKIGILADDLTGATTVGVLLARQGIKTSAFFSYENVREMDDTEAIIMSTDSRAYSHADARNAIGKAMSTLKKQNVKYFSKRIDTTLRGGIGCEVDAMLEYLDEETMAVIVPAMPQSNRILVGGYSIIDGVALSKTGVSKDVRTPVTETHVPTLYKRQTDKQVGQIQLASILAGKETLKHNLMEEKAKGAQAIIVDATSIEDIDLIAEAIIELEWNILSVDPGPFSERLATKREFGSDNAGTDSLETITVEEQEGKVIVVAGSATTVTEEQIKFLDQLEFSRTISINPVNLIDDEKFINEIERVFLKADQTLTDDNCKLLILDTAVFSETLNLKAVESDYNLEKGGAARKINTGVGTIVSKILDSYGHKEIAGLYLTGGDTMVSVLKTIGAKGIHLKDYVIPQTDLGEIIGGNNAGITVVGKGGLTGKQHTALDAVKRMYVEFNKKSNIKELV